MGVSNGKVSLDTLFSERKIALANIRERLYVSLDTLFIALKTEVANIRERLYVAFDTLLQ